MAYTKTIKCSELSRSYLKYIFSAHTVANRKVSEKLSERTTLPLGCKRVVVIATWKSTKKIGIDCFQMNPQATIPNYSNKKVYFVVILRGYYSSDY